MLAEAAEPGQVLISRATQELAAAAIETESAGPDRFILQSAQAAVRPLALRLDVPLVGRDEELRQLAAACAVASQEQVTTLVTVIGEAGIGKTRLVYEIERRHGHEVTVLTGRSLPYGEGIAFWPLRELIRQASGGHDSPDKIKVLLDGQPDAPEVAARLSLALGPGNQGRLDSAEIFWAARRLLTLARSRPLLVFSRTCTGPTDFPRPRGIPCRQQGRSPVVLVCVARRNCLNSVLPGRRERKSFFHQTHATRSWLCCGAPASLTGDQGLLLRPLGPGFCRRGRAVGCFNLEQLAALLSEQRLGSVIWLVLSADLMQALLGARLQRLGPGASSVLACAAI